MRGSSTFGNQRVFSRPRHPQVATALRYIAEHFTDPILTPEQVSAQVPMSARRLHDAFVKHIGRSIYQEILDRRIQLRLERNQEIGPQTLGYLRKLRLRFAGDDVASVPSETWAAHRLPFEIRSEKRSVLFIPIRLSTVRIQFDISARVSLLIHPVRESISEAIFGFL